MIIPMNSGMAYVIFRYNGYETFESVWVVDETEVTELSFSNEEFYNYIIQNFKYYIISSNDINKTIVIMKYGKNTDSMVINNSNLNSITDILQFDALVDLELNSTKITDVSAIYERLQKLRYKNSVNEEQLAVVNNKAELPPIIKYLRDNGNMIKAYIDYNVRDEKYLPTMTKTECSVIEENGKLLVKLDKSLLEGKEPSNRCVIIEISGDKMKEDSYLKINYAVEDILKLQHEYIDNQKYITNIKLKDNLLSKVLTDYPTLNNNNVTMTYANGERISGNDRVRTGTKIELKDANNDIIDSYTVAIKADVDGDGMLDVMDLSQVVLHIVEKIKLQRIYEIAADVNMDDELDVMDLSQMVLALIGKIEI